jgi:CDP-glycerol glycerophosphotransferase (TagB/SpsB family)
MQTYFFKHWLTSEDSLDYTDLKKNIDEANLYVKKNMHNGYILDPNLNIVDCLALSDVLITDESSVLYEAFLLNVPTVSVSDFVMRTNNSKPARPIKPIK